MSTNTQAITDDIIETAKKSADALILRMCMTMDHSFGLQSEQEQRGLRTSMTQLAEHDIAPAIAKAIHDAVMAERERGHWQPIATAPRDGTPILIQREQAEWPFIGYWANPYRYVKQGRGAWIGHEGGLHEDADGLMWQPLPAAPKSEGV